MSSSESKQEGDYTSAQATTTTTQTTSVSSFSRRRTTTSTTSLSPPPQMTTTPNTSDEGQTVPPINDIVVFYMKEQALAGEQRIYNLQQTGFTADSIECSDKGSFTRADLLRYNRIEVLVDEAMYNLLMKGEELDNDVNVKFKELDDYDKIICVINTFSTGNDLCDQLFYRLPKKTRRRFEGSQSKENVTPGVTPSGHIGMTGGVTETSNTAGTVIGDQNINKFHIEHADIYQISKEQQQQLAVKKIESMIKVKRERDVSPESDMVNIILEFSEEFQKIVEEVVRDSLPSPECVEKVEVRFGSIIIEMTLERGYNVTEEWIQNILKTLFNSKLALCISEGDKLRVTVQRRLYIQANEIPSLYVLHENSRLHENCIPNSELSDQTETLKSRIRELESDLERIREEQMTDSTDESVASSDTHTDTGMKTGREETLPMETNKWDIEEGDMRLVISSRNAMLNEACRSGKVDIVKGIISAGGVDINNSEEGLTPIMITALNGHKQLFDFLVEKGCDLSVMLDKGNNILHVACLGGNVDIVDFIITGNIVDKEGKGMYGRTAVMKAACVGQKKVFDLLVARGSDLSGVDDHGNNILHVACFSDSVDIVQYLITHNIADINSKGQCDRTPVMFAAEKGQKKVFDLLLTNGCDLSGVDNTDNNILHLACFSDNVDIVQYLITHNIANINSKGQDSTTPVMFAAEKGQKKVFDLLVARGSNLSGVDDNGNNILHLACFSDNVDIIQYLITHNIADINSKGKYGRTPVMMAAEKGQKKVFDLLVTLGSDLSGVDDNGATILHLAAGGGNVGMVEHILTDQTIDINSRDNQNMTPLQWARYFKQDKVVWLLLKRGAVYV